MNIDLVCIFEDQNRGGRYIRSAVDIDGGSRVLEEEPVAWAPGASPLCCHCAVEEGEGKLKQCSQCPLFVCDQCGDLDHSLDCSLAAAAVATSNTKDLVRDAVLLGRVARRGAADGSVQRLLQLDTHRQFQESHQAQRVARAKTLVSLVADVVAKSGVVDATPLSSEQLLDCWMIGNVNSFAIGSKMDSIGLYVSGALFSHSCVPTLAFETQTKAAAQPADQSEPLQGQRGPPVLKMHAVTDVPQFAELSISYVDLGLPTNARRRQLLETKAFLCQCARCMDETELQRFFRAFKCDKCNDGDDVVNAPAASSSSSDKTKESNKEENNNKKPGLVCPNPAGGSWECTGCKEGGGGEFRVKFEKYEEELRLDFEGLKVLWQERGQAPNLNEMRKARHSVIVIGKKIITKYLGFGLWHTHHLFYEMRLQLAKWCMFLALSFCSEIKGPNSKFETQIRWLKSGQLADHERDLVRLFLTYAVELYEQIFDCHLPASADSQSSVLSLEDACFRPIYGRLWTNLAVAHLCLALLLASPNSSSLDKCREALVAARRHLLLSFGVDSPKLKELNDLESIIASTLSNK